MILAGETTGQKGLEDAVVEMSVSPYSDCGTFPSTVSAGVWYEFRCRDRAGTTGTPSTGDIIKISRPNSSGFI